jgi:hypothetical protein
MPMKALQTFVIVLGFILFAFQNYASASQVTELNPHCEWVDLKVDQNNHSTESSLLTWVPREMTTDNTILHLYVVNECTGKERVLEDFAVSKDEKISEFTTAFSILTGLNRILFSRSRQVGSSLNFSNLLYLTALPNETTIEVTQKKVASYFIYYTSINFGFLRSRNGTDMFHVITIERTFESKKVEVPIAFIKETLLNHDQSLAHPEKILNQPKLRIMRDPLQFLSATDYIIAI